MTELDLTPSFPTLVSIFLLTLFLCILFIFVVFFMRQENLQGNAWYKGHALELSQKVWNIFSKGSVRKSANISNGLQPIGDIIPASFQVEDGPCPELQHEMGHNVDLESFDFPALENLMQTTHDSLTLFLDKQHNELEQLYNRMSREMGQLKSILGVKMHVQLDFAAHGFMNAMEMLVTGELLARQAFMDLHRRRELVLDWLMGEQRVALSEVSIETVTLYPIIQLGKKVNDFIETGWAQVQYERQRRVAFASYVEIVGPRIVEALAKVDVLDNQTLDKYFRRLFALQRATNRIYAEIEKEGLLHAMMVAHTNTMDKLSPIPAAELERYQRALMAHASGIISQNGYLTEVLPQLQRDRRAVEGKIVTTLTRIMNKMVEERWVVLRVTRNILFKGINPTLAKVLASLFGLRNGVTIDEDGKFVPRIDIDPNDPFVDVTDVYLAEGGDELDESSSGPEDDEDLHLERPNLGGPDDGDPEGSGDGREEDADADNDKADTVGDGGFTSPEEVARRKAEEEAKEKERKRKQKELRQKRKEERRQRIRERLMGKVGGQLRERKGEGGDGGDGGGGGGGEADSQAGGGTTVAAAAPHRQAERPEDTVDSDLAHHADVRDKQLEEMNRQRQEFLDRFKRSSVRRKVDGGDPAEDSSAARRQRMLDLAHMDDEAQAKILAKHAANKLKRHEARENERARQLMFVEQLLKQRRDASHRKRKGRMALFANRMDARAVKAVDDPFSAWQGGRADKAFEMAQRKRKVDLSGAPEGIDKLHQKLSNVAELVRVVKRDAEDFRAECWIDWQDERDHPPESTSRHQKKRRGHKRGTRLAFSPLPGTGMKTAATRASPAAAAAAAAAAAGSAVPGRDARSELMFTSVNAAKTTPVVMPASSLSLKQFAVFRYGVALVDRLHALGLVVPPPTAYAGTTPLAPELEVASIFLVPRRSTLGEQNLTMGNYMTEWRYAHMSTAYRNSAYYDHEKNTIFIRAHRLQSHQQFTLVLLHTLAHVSSSAHSGVWDDRNSGFVRQLSRLMKVACQEMFFSRSYRALQTLSVKEWGTYVADSISVAQQADNPWLVAGDDDSDDQAASAEHKQRAEAEARSNQNMLSSLNLDTIEVDVLAQYNVTTMDAETKELAVGELIDLKPMASATGSGERNSQDEEKGGGHVVVRASEAPEDKLRAFEDAEFYSFSERLKRHRMYETFLREHKLQGHLNRLEKAGLAKDADRERNLGIRRGVAKFRNMLAAKRQMEDKDVWRKLLAEQLEAQSQGVEGMSAEEKAASLMQFENVQDELNEGIARVFGQYLSMSRQLAELEDQRRRDYHRMDRYDLEKLRGRIKELSARKAVLEQEHQALEARLKQTAELILTHRI